MKKTLFSLTLLTLLMIWISCAPSREKMKFKLEPGPGIEKELTASQIHSYEVSLTAGQLVKVLAFQKGVDLVLTAFAPDGAKLKEIDSPNGFRGPERVTIQAQKDGIYRFDVQTLEPSSPGGLYEMSLEAVLSKEAAAKYVTVKVDHKYFDDFTGTYEAGKNHDLLIGHYDEGDLCFLQFLDRSTYQTRMLLARSDSEYFAGPAVMREFPVEHEFIFVRNSDGSVAGMRWTTSDQPTTFAKRKETHRRENITIQNGHVRLKGMLLIPTGKGPHPAVVHVHGSQAALRNLGALNAFFPGNGVALLSFDKRGAGESSGDWKTSSLEDLADDIIAGVDYLRTRPDIDTAHIGLYGISQGGWVSSIAASKSSEIKFMIVHSGSGVPVWENVVRETEGNLRSAGLEESEVKEAMDMAARTLEMASRGEEYEKIMAVFETARGKRWRGLIFPASLPKDDFNWNWFKLNGMYDAPSYLKDVRIPIFWAIGDKDWNVPPEKSVQRLTKAMQDGGNPDHEIKFIKGAHHSMIEMKTGFREEFESSTKYVDEFWTSLESWIAKHVGKK